MFTRISSLAAAVAVLTITSNAGVSAKKPRTNVLPFVESAKEKSVAGLWQQPADMRTRNLFYGPGGAAHQPPQTFTFLKEDLGGSNPKFDVRDAEGVKWKIKLGDETRSETVATRLLWAVGYHADEDYFLRSARVENFPRHLHRGGNLVGPGGEIHNVRLKRQASLKKGDEWKWRDAPFEGTREFNGLRVMMALINNWDLKDENNATFGAGEQPIYEVSDLGAAFGTTGVLLVKKNAKGNARSYEHSKFITKTTPEYVDFATPSLPSLPYVFNPFQYARRAQLRPIGKHVSRADAKWMGSLLAQLSNTQIGDAFRAAGFSPSEIAVFTHVVEGRIAQLNAL